MTNGKGEGEPRATAAGGALLDRRAVALLLLAAILALFAFNVRQQAFVGDDAYISFRYARNLAEGEGLVWNPGERVEGYTNFLWVLLASAAIRVGTDPASVAHAVGILSGAALLIALPLFGAGGSSRPAWAGWVAAAALAGNRSFTAWCTGGLETMLFTALVFFGYAALLYGSRRGRSRWALLSAGLFALAALTRPEGSLFALIAGVFLLGDALRKRATWRAFALASVVFLAPVSSHLIWRHAYYGFWLPNSFVAKVPGAWWEQGLRYLDLFAGDYRIAWLLPPLLAGLVLRPCRSGGLFGAAVVAYLTYVAYVGGDRFEFRFVVVVLPYFYLLVANGAEAVARRWPGVAGRVAAGLCALALLATSCAGSRTASAREMRHGVASLEIIAGYASRRVEEGRFLRGLVDRGLLPADLALCVGGAGALPYYTRWPTLDRRGINDLRIARLPLADRGVIAHERDVPQAYLLERRIAVFDVFNRLVHERDILAGRPSQFAHDGALLPLRALRVDGRYLVFATTLPDAEFRRRFGRLEIVQSGKRSVGGTISEVSGTLTPLRPIPSNRTPSGSRTTPPAIRLVISISASCLQAPLRSSSIPPMLRSTDNARGLALPSSRTLRPPIDARRVALSSGSRSGSEKRMWDSPRPTSISIWLNHRPPSSASVSPSVTVSFSRILTSGGR